MEQLHALHTRLDERVKTQMKLLRRDALRDHPAAITPDSAATPMAAYSGSTGEYLTPPLHPLPAHCGLSHRFTINHGFVAHTVYQASDLDGDSFPLSIRMDAPMMIKTGDFKIPETCLSFISVA
jgi:hypothetical protein